MYKIVMYNSIHNNGTSIKYDYNIIKVTTSFNKAIEIALELKRRTKKLYKVERV